MWESKLSAPKKRLVEKLNAISRDEGTKEEIVLIASSDIIYRALIRIENLRLAGVVFPSFLSLEELINDALWQLTDEEADRLVGNPENPKSLL